LSLECKKRPFQKHSTLSEKVVSLAASQKTEDLDEVKLKNQHKK
jgi:hypothetical protein